MNEITHLKINGNENGDGKKKSSSSSSSSPNSYNYSSYSLDNFLIGSKLITNNVSDNDDYRLSKTTNGLLNDNNSNYHMSSKKYKKKTSSLITNEKNRYVESQPVSQDIYIVVQPLGSGRVVRIVSDISDLKMIGSRTSDSAEKTIVSHVLLCCTSHRSEEKLDRIK